MGFLWRVIPLYHYSTIPYSAFYKLPKTPGISSPYTFVSQSSADDTQTDIAGQYAYKFASVKIPGYQLHWPMVFPDGSKPASFVGNYKVIHRAMANCSW